MGDFLFLITEFYTENNIANLKEIIHPLEYFEDEKHLKLFKQIGSKIYKAVVPKQEGIVVEFKGEELDLEQFKNRFLLQKRTIQLLQDYEEEVGSAEEQEENIEKQPVEQD